VIFRDCFVSWDFIHGYGCIHLEMLLNKGMVSLRYLEMVVPLSGEEKSYFGIFHFDFNIRSGKS